MRRAIINQRVLLMQDAHSLKATTTILLVDALLFQKDLRFEINQPLQSLYSELLTALRESAFLTKGTAVEIWAPSHLINSIALTLLTVLLS
jgi:hypothetical protein